MKCTKCGYTNAEGALVCNLCGDMLPKADGGADGGKASLSESAGDREKLAKTELDPYKFRKKAAAPEIIIAPDLIPEEVSQEPSETTENFCLVCPPLDPVPLMRDRICTIGRSKANDVILPVGVVSRHHSEIRWTGEGFEVSDLGSFNGTYVNGEKVDKGLLKDGDDVQIGPYSLQVRSYAKSIEEVTAALGVGEKTEIFQAVGMFDRDSSFSGRIGEVKMEEIFQLVDFNKKTGTLEIQSGEKRGRFHFQDGQILDASFHNSHGETAVARVLNLQSGNFAFSTGVPDVERTVFESTSKVLLNCMRRLDELG